jgi:hypothetical protein
VLSSNRIQGLTAASGTRCPDRNLFGKSPVFDAAFRTTEFGSPVDGSPRTRPQSPGAAWSGLSPVSYRSRRASGVAVYAGPSDRPNPPQIPPLRRQKRPCWYHARTTADAHPQPRSYFSYIFRRENRDQKYLWSVAFPTHSTMMQAVCVGPATASNISIAPSAAIFHDRGLCRNDPEHKSTVENICFEQPEARRTQEQNPDRPTLLMIGQMTARQ